MDECLGVYLGGRSIELAAALCTVSAPVLCTDLRSSNPQMDWNCLRPWYAIIAAHIVATVPKMLSTNEQRASKSLGDIEDAEVKSDQVAASSC